MVWIDDLELQTDANTLKNSWSKSPKIFGVAYPS